MARVAGIDVAATRPSTAVLVEDGNVVQWADLRGADDLLRWLGEHRPAVVAIDAPSSLSKGLLAHPQDGTKPYNGRVCDRELRRRSISLYEVPDARELAPEWMEVGYQLFEAAAGAGYRLPTQVGKASSVIEIYPYASFAVLLSGRPDKKSKERGLQQRVRAIQDFGLVWDGRRDHDSLDALAAAATAVAYLEGRATAVGDPSEALLWLPVPSLLPSYSAPVSWPEADADSPGATAPAMVPSPGRTPCLCGCGGYPKKPTSRFLPGHDAKYYSRLRKGESTKRDNPESPRLAELEALLSGLNLEQRGELLEELLVAAPHGGGEMMAVLNAWLISAAGEEFLEDLPG